MIFGFFSIVAQQQQQQQQQQHLFKHDKKIQQKLMWSWYVNFKDILNLINAISLAFFHGKVNS